MLPPVLEIYIVWHPADQQGKDLCDEFFDHFHGTVFSGLVGGAIEVYARSDGWLSTDGSPRPLPFAGTAAFPGVRSAQFIAIVPILGIGMAQAVQSGDGPWHAYLRDISAARDPEPRRVGVFPYLLHPRAIDGTVLGGIFGQIQRIAANALINGDTDRSVRCRDLSQGVAQLLSQTNERLTVFLSHTKRGSTNERQNVDDLIRLVRSSIGDTRLREFFDANDLQPGRNWEPELRQRAATSALLALRTDLYASREWCQKEVLIAKRAGMPVIVMDALGDREERGSFLMDHVPRVAARMTGGQWKNKDVLRTLDLLVDECLKRAVWQRQAELARGELDYGIDWWAPHAPEPITLSGWLSEVRNAGTLRPEGADVVVLHPDPPLGPDELATLQEMLSLSGIRRQLDVVTPRTLAARGA